LRVKGFIQLNFHFGFSVPKERAQINGGGQWNTGRYKAHCFFKPTVEDCEDVY